MRLGVKTALFAGVLTAVVGVAALAQGQPPAQGAAQAPQNLQVLPKDMTRQQVQAKMRTIAASLGVECSHCHVGTMAERAKDDNPKKAIARQMLKMTAAINNDLLKGVGEPAPAGTEKVTCFTCHRGAIKPLTAPAGGGF